MSTKQPWSRPCDYCKHEIFNASNGEVHIKCPICGLGCNWLRQRNQPIPSTSGAIAATATGYEGADSGPTPIPDVPVGEIISRDRKIAVLTEQVKLLKSKYSESIKTSVATEQILWRLDQALEALPPVAAPPPMKAKQGVVKESAVLVGSCWHIGEVIDKEAMGGLNEYDLDIFARRLQHIVEKAISFTHENMSNHYFETLHVILTGDMVSGIIHDELVETNEVHIVDQALLGALITAQALQDLARAFPKVVVTGVVGNHGRTQPQKQFKHKGSKSWDYVFYNTLAMLLKHQTNVSFIIPRSYWAVVDIEGHLFQVSHGDNLKGSLGIPFYSFKREVGKWMEINAAQNRIVRYFITSHFHTKAILQTGIGELIMNASLKGGDDYAIGLGLYGDPIQLLFGVNEKYGKTWELSLNAKYTNEEPRYMYDLTKPIAYQMDLVK